ncbi:oxidized purine nucleoside triphosphate hydrolase-like isoform X2 [Schistocerca americana]|uniref:oxidized purine nucleoside triphosphate hydrolase-like isoform X2 n=1 Tax=Schistocerca americana TaxID=7009 RepID=UPI001F5038D3|nr:oxidized purine nucleoside triphosphate hydrolase-like isoform X2 [Schistocerca americana]
MFRKLLTLVIVQRDREILLGLKKRGFGKGKWNGFGGKVEPGETIQCAAARELQEESGLTALDLKHVGVIEFEFVGDLTILEVHVFKTHKWSGNVSESDEMLPKWYSIDEIPFDKMWADDRHWLPLILQGHKIKGYFLFEGHSTILRHDLNIVTE